MNSFIFKDDDTEGLYIMILLFLTLGMLTLQLIFEVIQKI